MEQVGIVFISPIIGLTPSLRDTLSYFSERGFPVETVDIFYAGERRSFWRVLGLTVVPGANKRRIHFANRYNESGLFARIAESIGRLREKGCIHIVLGGMSGGFIFASRIGQLPLDAELDTELWRTLSQMIVGVFGIGPLIFYPAGVKCISAYPDRIPAHIPVVLIWGEDDDIVPKGTLEHGASLAQAYPNIKVLILRKSDFPGRREIRHQFFGGKDFIGRLRNIFWHPTAEKAALEFVAREIPIFQKNKCDC